jgi:hypothetical protein
MDVEALVEAPFVKQQQNGPQNGRAPTPGSPPRERCVLSSLCDILPLCFVTDANAGALQARLVDPLRRPSLAVAVVRVLAPFFLPPAAQVPP